MRVELVHDSDCPNVPAARRALLQAFARAGVQPRWTEWATSDPACPGPLRRLGSPSVLVDGRDVAGGGSEQASCRLYPGPDGRLSPVPPVEVIAEALGRSRSGAGAAGAEPPKRGWRSFAAAAPFLGVTLLPKVACPMCWPAYAGLASAAGLGFLLDARNLLLVTLAALLVVLAALAWRARTRHGYGPLLLGAVASGAILLGKFLWDMPPVAYAAGALLMAACLWNAWPRRRDPVAETETCSACPPESTANEEARSMGEVS